MKSFFILLLAIHLPLLGTNVPPKQLTGNWNGLREDLKEKGVEFIAYMDLDNIWNLYGGIQPSPCDRLQFWFDATVTITSNYLFHYEGGLFGIEFQSHHGRSPTFLDVGSFMFVDVIEGPPLNSLYSLWYKHTFNEHVWMLVGKTDAYDYFTNVSHAFVFLNGGYTALPTILGLPTYPDSAMSAIASFTYDQTSLTFAIYDGSLVDGFATGSHGVLGRFFNHLDRHLFMIAEWDLSWKDCYGNVGKLGIGGWGHTGSFPRFEGGFQKGACGPYLTLDQVLFHKEDKEELAFFLLYSIGNSHISAARQYLGLGLTWQGLIDSRCYDTLGMGMSRAYFSQKEGAGFTKKSETSYEIFYQYFITPWSYLLPDFQYIVNPGGKGLPNASVFALRLEMSF